MYELTFSIFIFLGLTYSHICAIEVKFLATYEGLSILHLNYKVWPQGGSFASIVNRQVFPVELLLFRNLRLLWQLTLIVLLLQKSELVIIGVKPALILSMVSSKIFHLFWNTVFHVIILPENESQIGL